MAPTTQTEFTEEDIAFAKELIRQGLQLGASEQGAADEQDAADEQGAADEQSASDEQGVAVDEKGAADEQSASDEQGVAVHEQGAADNVEEPKVVGDSNEYIQADGFIWNHRKDENPTLNRYDKKIFCGFAPQPPYPLIMKSRPPYYSFHVQGPGDAGPRGAFVYSFGTDSNARSWLVAYDIVAKLVYAEAGPASPVDWDLIFERLMSAGTNHQGHKDTVSGSKLYAEVDDYQNSLHVVFH